MSVALPARVNGLPGADTLAPASTLGLRLTLLKAFELRRGEEVVVLAPAVQRLVAFLALGDRPLRRAYVAGMLWPEASQEHASANLRSTLWRIGRSGCALAEGTATHLRLPEAVSVDVRQAAVVARAILHETVPRDDLTAASLSLDGDILPDWYDDWVLVEQERFRQLRLHALEALCRRLTDENRMGQAVEAGLAAVTGEPLRESAHRVLIRAYLAEGNGVEAVRQYRFCRRLLQEELGVEPTAELSDMVAGLTAP